jgi:hypothetical protein
MAHIARMPVLSVLMSALKLSSAVRSTGEHDLLLSLEMQGKGQEGHTTPFNWVKYGPVPNKWIDHCYNSILAKPNVKVLRLVPMRALPPAPGVVAPATWPVLPGGADVEAGAACSGSGRLRWCHPGRYQSWYRLPLEPAVGS